MRHVHGECKLLKTGKCKYTHNSSSNGSGELIDLVRMTFMFQNLFSKMILFAYKNIQNYLKACNLGYVI